MSVARVLLLLPRKMCVCVCTYINIYIKSAITPSIRRSKDLNPTMPSNGNNEQLHSTVQGVGTGSNLVGLTLKSHNTQFKYTVAQLLTIYYLIDNNFTQLSRNTNGSS